MIRSFRDRNTEELYHRQTSRRWANMARVALRKLRLLDRARTLQDLMAPPNNRLEKLVGDRAGEYSIRVNDQYRICFRWKGSDAFDVEIADYH